REDREMRTWSDASGKFKVQAKFYSAGAENVKLLTADDRKIDVPIAKLCEADKEYLRSVFKAKGIRASF
ncbi:MAG: hypothetical protein HKN47_20865, partial [Pirellulaceae bacterium]|nr:hypothetical protein [Pirellulaceae bacterium]